jgi:membrane protein
MPRAHLGGTYFLKERAAFFFKAAFALGPQAQRLERRATGTLSPPMADSRTSGSNDPKEHRASSPWQMPWPAWKDVIVRTWSESSDDNAGIVAAGVAFYGFLALVPLLGAIVLSYGFVAEPRTVLAHVQSLTKVMPADAAKLVGEQLLNVVQQSSGKKGLGILVALAIALFGARNAAGSIITALNIAYEEKEKRGFIKVNLLSIGITVAAVAVALAALSAVASLGFLQDLLPSAGGFLIALGKIVAYVALGLLAAAVAASLYRYGPSRQHAKWEWITPGSLFTAVTWLILTLGFGFFVSKFGNYDKTYGSLGAVIVLLTWMYLSSYVLLLGAELNSELEHQTVADTVEVAPKALAERGAWPAGHDASPSNWRRPGEVSASLPLAVETAPAQQASPTRDYVAARVTNRLGRFAGLRKVGMLSSVLATAGLAMMRKRGRMGAGAVLLAAAAGLSLLKREDEQTAGLLPEATVAD